MFRLFKEKKKETIEEHITFVINNEVNFQLDVLREGDVDFQIFRQRMLEHLNVSVNHPNGIAILISFNLKNIESINHHKKFTLLPIYNECEKIKILEDPDDDYDHSFILKINNNKKEVLSLISLIQNSVFNYDDKTIYFLNFKEI